MDFSIKFELRLNLNLPSPTFLHFNRSKEKSQVPPSPLSLHMFIIIIHVIFPKKKRSNSGHPAIHYPIFRVGRSAPLSGIDYSGLTKTLKRTSKSVGQATILLVRVQINCLKSGYELVQNGP